MEKPIREFFGRAFSAEEIELIQWTARTYPQLSRNEMAKTICEFLDWNQLNGEPKKIQSVSLLKKLEEEGIINLRPRIIRKKPTNGSESQSHVSVGETSAHPVKSADERTTNANEPLIEHEEINECGEIELIKVRQGEELSRWAGYVRQYHKVGYKIAFGAQIRYFIRSGGEDLGCLQFSASSWSLAPRDKWIGWTAEERKARLHLIVNNSRFLVLPWVHVNNYASRALSKAARQIQGDWLEAYCYAPVLLETFVEPPYKGTTYKASNWTYLGETQGRGRGDRNSERLLTRKSIYVLPLQRDFRAVLKGEKPCKAVTPDGF